MQRINVRATRRSTVFRRLRRLAVCCRLEVCRVLTFRNVESMSVRTFNVGCVFSPRSSFSHRTRSQTLSDDHMTRQNTCTLLTFAAASLLRVCGGGSAAPRLRLRGSGGLAAAQLALG